jgi:hypothetical protein
VPCAARNDASLKIAGQHYSGRKRIEFLDFIDEVAAAGHCRFVLDNSFTHKPKRDMWRARHLRLMFLWHRRSFQISRATSMATPLQGPMPESGLCCASGPTYLCARPPATLDVLRAFERKIAAGGVSSRVTGGTRMRRPARGRSVHNSRMCCERFSRVPTCSRRTSRQCCAVSGRDEALLLGVARGVAASNSGLLYLAHQAHRVLLDLSKE